MKISVPKIKKNKEKKTASRETESFSGFDLTGGQDAGSSQSSAGAGAASRNTQPFDPRSATAESFYERAFGGSPAGMGAGGQTFSAGYSGDASSDTGPGRVRALYERAFGRSKKTASDTQTFTSGTFSAGQSFAAGSLADPEKDGFAVNVRNSEPIIRRLDKGKTRFSWAKGIQINLATAIIVMSILWLLFTSADEAMLTLFTIPGIAVFMLVAFLENSSKERLRLYVSAAIFVALIAGLIVFRKYIGSGCALIMNQLYDYAEEAQAYIYNRFPVGSMGDEHPHRSMHFAAVWGSCLLGLITALPHESSRRSVAVAAAGFSMIAFAYYGIIPSWVCIAVMAVTLVFVLARGSILAALPVLLSVMLVFGAITLIDPGESYSISRADENFRDRFALISSYLDAGDSLTGDPFELENDQQISTEENTSEEDNEFINSHKGMIGIIVLVLILAALCAIGWMFLQRIRKRQKLNRAGIDSADPREAIVAMFPYAVRWLQPAGIETSGRNFASLIPVVRRELPQQYGDRFAGMYELWSEAAYSDHEMSDDRKTEMKGFLNETIRMIKEKSDFRTKVLSAVRYAL